MCLRLGVLVGMGPDSPGHLHGLGETQRAQCGLVSSRSGVSDAAEVGEMAFW